MAARTSRLYARGVRPPPARRAEPLDDPCPPGRSAPRRPARAPSRPRRGSRRSRRSAARGACAARPASRLRSAGRWAAPRRACPRRRRGARVAAVAEHERRRLERCADRCGGGAMRPKNSPCRSAPLGPGSWRISVEHHVAVVGKKPPRDRPRRRARRASSPARRTSARRAAA